MRKSELLAVLDEFEDDLLMLGTPEEVMDKKSFYTRLALASSGSDKEHDPFKPYSVEEGVLTIPVTGMLLDVDFAMDGFVTGYGYIQETLSRASEDSNVESVKLAVDSPGGRVSGMFETADMLKDFDKPVVAEIDSVGASAAYALASQADVVRAKESSRVGSIGVIIKHQNVAKALDKAGIETSVFKSGKFKDFGSPHRALTKEEKTLLQEDVDQSATAFFDLVAEGRDDISASDVKDMEARVYSGAEAVKKGLVDETVSRTKPKKEKTSMGHKAEATVETINVDEIASAAKSEGIKMEQDRVSAIMSHKKAAMFPDTVKAFISEGVDAKTAAVVLDTLEATKVEKTEAKSDMKEAFDKAMSKDNPEITDASAEEEDTSEDDPALAILADFKAAKGIK